MPTYDRSALQRGVVHIGAGNFHRAHQAVYFDDLARSGISDRWGVTGVSLRSRDVKDLLSAQDGLYTVVQRGHDRQTARVVGSIGSVHYAPNDGAAVRAALADPQTRIVSLTITGNGYFLNPVTDEFDAEPPRRARRPRQRSDSYATAWGYLAEALDRRRRAGIAPFTVLCCDNIPGDTQPARTALVSFAALKDPGLARWIDTHVAFPSTMVDRITPQTSESERKFVEQTFGVADKWPVVTEPYRQWVIEDSLQQRSPAARRGRCRIRRRCQRPQADQDPSAQRNPYRARVSGHAGRLPAHRRGDAGPRHLRLRREAAARRDSAAAARRPRDEHSRIPGHAARPAQQSPNE